MKRIGIFLMVLILLFVSADLAAQCSICTKTAAQLGEKTGRGLNGGILYLAAAPIAIVGFITYKWYKNNR